MTGKVRTDRSGQVVMEGVATDTEYEDEKIEEWQQEIVEFLGKLEKQKNFHGMKALHMLIGAFAWLIDENKMLGSVGINIKPDKIAKAKYKIAGKNGEVKTIEKVWQ